MSFHLSSFVDLVTKYNSWDALKAFLTSVEGGSLRVLDASPKYSIVRYVKGKSDFTKVWVREARSVVWDVESNRPVCFAPIKAEKGYPPKDLSGAFLSDFVDGTMINAFRPSTGSPVITTRTSLNATNTFYDFYSTPQQSFAEMFTSSLTSFGSMEQFLNSILEPNQFASFVLQHPSNRIVAPVSQPRIFVVALGSIKEDGSALVNTNTSTFPSTLLPFAPCSYTHPVDFKALCKKGSYWQGVVFQDSASSRRWRLRNPSYTVLRTLRGPEACGFERFLRLRREGSMKEYLKCYSDESKLMWAYETLFRTTTQDLYDAYVEKNKLKKKGMKDLDLPLRTHVYALHGKYLASVQAGTAVPVTKESVIQYVNMLSLDDQKKLVGTKYSGMLVSS